jgi:hypothetical protein
VRSFLDLTLTMPVLRQRLGILICIVWVSFIYRQSIFAAASCVEGMFGFNGVPHCNGLEEEVSGGEG